MLKDYEAWIPKLLNAKYVRRINYPSAELCEALEDPPRHLTWVPHSDTTYERIDRGSVNDGYAIQVFAPEGKLESCIMAKSIANCLPESRYARVGFVPTLDVQHPGHERNATALRQWLHHCIENHEECRMSFNGQKCQEQDDLQVLPTRVVEVTDTPNSENTFCVLARLFVTGGTRGRYLTLSHRWSSSRACQLLKENTHQLQEHIPTTHLTLTFRHAILMTKLLGFRYLWIDSLCIVQDDYEDRKREIGKMGDIFENATCMLAAVDTIESDGSDAGLFNRVTPGPKPVRWPCSIWQEKHFELLGASADRSERLPPFVDELGLKIANPQGWYIVRHSEWHGRGWVMQERMLSRRVVYFTKYKLLWDCRRGNGDEDRRGLHQWLPHRDMPGDHHRSHAQRPMLKEDQNHLQQWTWLVEEYSKCTLTEELDKYLAISGIQQRFETRWAVRIEYGILLDKDGACVLSSLLWIAEEKSRKGYQQFSSPSWSWMGLNGAVTYNAVTATCSPIHSIVRGPVSIKDGRLLFSTILRSAGLGSAVADMRWRTFDEYLPITGSCIYGQPTKTPRGIVPEHYLARTPDPKFPPQTRILKASRHGRIIGWAALDYDTPLRCTDIFCAAIQYQRAAGSGIEDNDMMDKISEEFEEYTDVLVLECACEAKAGSVANEFRRIGRGAVVVASWFQNHNFEDIVVI